MKTDRPNFYLNIPISTVKQRQAYSAPFHKLVSCQLKKRLLCNSELFIMMKMSVPCTVMKNDISILSTLKRQSKPIAT